ncbi:MAG TPA: hypothetical protein VMU16_07540 [Candidatus Binataceae bacterium]|nr:hypothetical protein [Candidatus Binataceae bacterium]
MLSLIAATALVASACTSSQPSTVVDLSKFKLKPAPAGSCVIDAVRMCNDLAGGGGTPQRTGSPDMPSLPESLDFQIPAGQSIKLTCYFQPGSGAAVKANARADAPLTDNSVAYLRSQKFCAKK